MSCIEYKTQPALTEHEQSGLPTQGQAKEANPGTYAGIPTGTYEPESWRRGAAYSEPAYRLSRVVTHSTQENDYWLTVGKGALAMLPQSLHVAFIDWVSEPEWRERLRVYEANFSSAVFAFLENIATNSNLDRQNAIHTRIEAVEERNRLYRDIQALKNELSEAHARTYETELRLQDAIQIIATLEGRVETVKVAARELFGAN